MIRIPRPLRVVLAGSATIAMVTAGAAALVATPAHADVTSKITINPAAQTGAAGTCLAYTLSITDAVGRAATDSGTVEVAISENPTSDTQDVDFCVPAGDTSFSQFAVYPNYSNVNVPNQAFGTPQDCPRRPPALGSPPNGCTETYAPGPSITTSASDAPSNPPAGQTDNPDAATGTAPNTTGFPPKANVDNNANPSGTDYASFTYGAGKTIKFGVVGLIPGGATIDAYTTDRDPQISATQASATFRTGGRPGVEAANAARSITVTPNPSVRPIATPTHTFAVTVRNGTGDTLLGVIPSYIVQSGPGTNTAPVDCPATDNSGQTTCTYTASATGTDNLLFFVNQSTGSATAGPDAGEPQTNVTATTTPPPVAAQFAYTIDLTPDTATTPANGSRTFTAAVTAQSGAPAQGVSLNFTETGPGVFRGSTDSNGASVTTGTTDATGRASVIVDVPNGVSGTETITVTIVSPETTQCQTAGGRCTDVSTNTISGSASPSPTPSSTRSASPTGSPSGGRRALTLFTSTPNIQPTDDGILNASGQPGASVELRCYTRPNTAYFTARGPSNLSSGGSLQFVIHPGANTRCYVRYAGDEASASPSVVINVHTTLSLSAYRDGVRKYHFQGTNLPRRAGQLITLYRWARRDNNGYCDPHIAAGDYTASSSDPNCFAVRTATAYTNSTNVWRIDRTFTGSGQFVFQVRTSQTLTNANGVSNPRLTIIH